MSSGVRWRRYSRCEASTSGPICATTARSWSSTATVGFVGSQNLIDRSYNKTKNLKRGLQWQELMTRVEGPVVHSMNAVFLTDWYSETGEVLTDQTPRPGEEPAVQVGELDCQIVPSGPGFDNDNNLKLFNSLIYHAATRVSLTSPYFVPNESLICALTTAAERGVEVELFVSELGDQPMVYHAQRSYYEVMLRAGVRIHLRRSLATRLLDNLARLTSALQRRPAGRCCPLPPDRRRWAVHSRPLARPAHGGCRAEGGRGCRLSRFWPGPSQPLPQPWPASSQPCPRPCLQPSPLWRQP